MSYIKVSKKQYTGKAVERFRLCWNNYKESDRRFLMGKEVKLKFLYNLFLNENHKKFIEDNDICLIDKTNSSDPHTKGILQDQKT